MEIKLSEHFTYKKLIRFTIPTIVMMIFTSIYGVVDGLFVSNYAGSKAFASINLIMPAIMILGTIGIVVSEIYQFFTWYIMNITGEMSLYYSIKFVFPEFYIGLVVSLIMIFAYFYIEKKVN